MLAGCPPFRAETPIAVALKHLKDTPISLMVLRPEIPIEIDRLVLKLMEKSPADRFQSAAEMLRDLAKAKEAINATTGATGAPEISGLLPSADGDPDARSSGSASTLRSHDSSSAGLSPARLPLPATNSKGGIALAILCLVAGAVCGWLMRSADLLAAKAPEPPVPGLWIAPDWAMVPNQPTAEAQFEYALFVAQPEEAEAAWVAVAGYHPRAHEWIAQSYIQLARRLLRRRDVDRLKAFAAEITRWSESRTHEEHLANIIQAGVKALDGDIEGVTRDFAQQVTPASLADPALAELGVEVTLQAMDIASHTAAPPSFAHLQEARRQLTDALYRLSQSQLGRGRPRPR
jgi:serine/threonine-protein kinase